MWRTFFIRAALAELTWGKVIAMHGLLLLWTEYRFIPNWPPPAAWLVNEVVAVNLLFAILFAREAVKRGLRPMIAFPASLVLSCWT